MKEAIAVARANCKDFSPDAVIGIGVAKLAYYTLALNPQQSPVPQALLDKHFFRKHGPSAYYGQPDRSKE